MASIPFAASSAWMQVLGISEPTEIPEALLPLKDPEYDEGAPIVKLTKDLDKIIDAWCQTPCRQRLLRKLHQGHPAGLPIPKAVCTRVGSLMCNDPVLRKRNLFQLAIFMDVTTNLWRMHGLDMIDGKPVGGGILLILQDPSLCEEDKAFLRGLNINCLDFTADLALAKNFLVHDTVLFDLDSTVWGSDMRRDLFLRDDVLSQEDLDALARFEELLLIEDPAQGLFNFLQLYW